MFRFGIPSQWVLYLLFAAPAGTGRHHYWLHPCGIRSLTNLLAAAVPTRTITLLCIEYWKELDLYSNRAIFAIRILCALVQSAIVEQYFKAHGGHPTKTSNHPAPETISNLVEVERLVKQNKCSSTTESKREWRHHPRKGVNGKVSRKELDHKQRTSTLAVAVAAGALLASYGQEATNDEQGHEYDHDLDAVDCDLEEENEAV
jgi:hypothetical protein